MTIPARYPGDIQGDRAFDLEPEGGRRTAAGGQSLESLGRTIRFESFYPWHLRDRAQEQGTELRSRS